MAKKLTKKQIEARWQSYNQWQNAKSLGDDIRRERKEKQKGTFMRVDKDLLKEIAEVKLVKAESYADVVKRLIDKERRAK